MVKEQYKLNRSGVIVTTPEQATDFQCVKQGHNKYYYWCEVLFSDPQLDERGFLADHGALDKFITEQCVGPLASCELMIRKVGKAVGKWLAEAGMPADSVYLKFASTITGSEGTIEGWLYIDDSTNRLWHDRAQAVPRGTKLAQDAGLAPGFQYLDRRPAITEVNTPVGEGACILSNRRFKTPRELGDMHLWIEGRRFYETQNAYANQEAFLTTKEREYLEMWPGSAIPTEVKFEYRYFKFHAQGMFYAIPIWATTCKPLN